jgi:hypothetical protein
VKASTKKKTAAAARQQAREGVVMQISDNDVVGRTVKVPMSTRTFLRIERDENGEGWFNPAALGPAVCKMRIYSLIKSQGVTFKMLAHEAGKPDFAGRAGYSPVIVRRYLRALVAEGFLAIDKHKCAKAEAQS